MTEFIAHRVNDIADLRELPREFGVEIDLRDSGDRLIVVHDPFSDGGDFEEYLQEYHHGTMILNIKSERIEHRVLEMIAKADVKSYFFLDSSFPMISVLTEQGEKNVALRFSEFEGLDTVFNMQSKVGWVWVDCFTHLPINCDIYSRLKAAGFKLCLVSPDLVGRQEEIEAYREQLESGGIVFDAICTKSYNIDRWR
jgi:hypothetical protein